MTEHQHTNTYPGEPVAPEIIDHPIQPEPGAAVQTDDINVPLVAIIFIISAILLVLIIGSLQAWFYTWSGEEREAKIEPSVALIEMRQSQSDQLTGTQPHTIPIQQAMDFVVQESHRSQPRP